MNIKEVADLCSMGTLFAFALVSAGVLVLQDRRNAASKSNKIALEKGLTVNPDAYKSGFRVPHIDGFILIPMLLFAFVILRFPLELADFNTAIEKGVTIGDHLYHKLPAIIFLILFVFVTIQTVLRKWSLIPVLGILTNMYLMSELSTLNWMRFLLWCVIGIAVYFGYSYRNSKLNPKNEQA